MEVQLQWKTFLRWLAFLPAAFLTSWLAWFLVTLGNKLTMGMQDVDPNSFLARTFIEFVSNVVMGATFVYVGAKVAPSHHNTVAYVLAGFGLVAAGFMLFPALMIGSYWAIWAGASLVFGLGATAYSVNSGEIQLEVQQQASAPKISEQQNLPDS